MLQEDSIEAQYISNKKTLLNAAGTKLNDLYYSNLNSTVQAVECTFFAGKYRQNLGSPNFGSISTVLIPNGSFIGSTWLHLELQNLPPNVSLPRGWGYACLSNITFLMGSSNTTSLSLSGESVWQVVAAQCDTAEKRSELFRLGGESYTSPVIPTGSEAPRLCADIYLPFPFSAAGGHDKLPFDSQLLDNPITIQVQFKQATAIFGGTGVKPTNFSQAVVFIRQGDLTNKDVSLRLKMLNNVGTYITYPFMYYQSNAPIPFQGSSLSTQGQCSVQLNSFINGDLVGLIISVVRRSRTAPAGNATPNPLIYDTIKDVELRLNGQIIYYAPYESYKIVTSDTILGGSYYQADLFGSQAVAPFITQPVDVYPLLIDFSRKRNMVFHNEMPNVFRIPTQPMQLLFKTETDELYDLYATYVYNAVDEISIGTSTIHYD